MTESELIYKAVYALANFYDLDLFDKFPTVRQSIEILRISHDSGLADAKLYAVQHELQDYYWFVFGDG